MLTKKLNGSQILTSQIFSNFSNFFSNSQNGSQTSQIFNEKFVKFSVLNFSTKEYEFENDASYPRKSLYVTRTGVEPELRPINDHVHRNNGVMKHSKIENGNV